MNNKQLVSILVLGVFTTVLHVGHCGCSREYSRLVRNALQTKLYPLYAAVDSSMPQSCPLFLERDMYGAQESNKIMETINKWMCDYCGKSFLHEYFLDLHFQNRHSEYVRKEADTVCLADYCDYFRCDVVSGKKTADFWDVALCLEDDMEELAENCKVLNLLLLSLMCFFIGCIPDRLSRNDTEFLKNNMFNEVCSFLTCSKFWETKDEKMNSSAIVMYVVFTVFTFIVLIIYYCVAYHYFFTDTFSDVYDERYENTTLAVAKHRAEHIEMRQRRRISMT
ncbi:hypothetical protein ScPMuIL_016148 [Solemya velum]